MPPAVFSSEVLGVFWLDEGEQGFGGLGRKFGEEVGRVVGVHLLDDVGGAPVLEASDDLDAVVLGEFLEDVGELLVIECECELDAALGAQLVHEIGEVCRPQFLYCREKALDPLLGVGQGQPRDS